MPRGIRAHRQHLLRWRDVKARLQFGEIAIKRQKSLDNFISAMSCKSSAHREMVNGK
jgi:hypothetical protein